MILAKGEKCVTIDEPRKIDFVVFPKGRDDLVELWIADHLAWGYGDDDTVEHLVLLQEKVNSYLEYIGGQLTEDFPEAEGRRVVIRIRALEGPPPVAKDAIRKLGCVLEDLGIGFVCEVGAGE